MITPNLTLRRIRRFQQVINVLVKFGFSEVLNRIRVWEEDAIEKNLLKRDPKMQTEHPGYRLRMALEELGPTFIKLGQILSTRPDLIDADIIAELKKLQSSAHFIPIETIRGIIETELGGPVEEIFDSFEETPLAAASLAQVHRAVYRGEHVAIKIQRPNIAETTARDIEIMRSLAGLVEKHSATMYLLNPLGIVDMFADQIKRELDFQLEAQNMIQFARNFADDDTLYVPSVYSEMCTKRLITMEFLDGIGIANVEKLIKEDYNLQLIARRGAVIGFKATFQHGFFHADPHPGNVLVLPGNRIGLLDYGMMATLSSRDRERLAKLVYFVSVRDERRVARALNELMESEETIPSEELEPAMATIIQQYAEASPREMKLAAMLFAMINTIMKFGGRLRSQLIWVSKSIAIQEDIISSLKADFNVIDVSKPYARKYLVGSLNPFTQSQEIYLWFMDAIGMVKDLPYDFSVIIKEFRKGRLKIEFEHVGLEPIRSTLERAANRLSLTVIISALLISSSLVVMSGIKPDIGGIPVLSFIGYLLSLLLLLVLIFSPVRR